MPHRGHAHARRRAYLSGRQDIDWTTREAFNPDHPGLHILPDFDETTYDDLVPIRFRAALVVDDNGEPADLSHDRD